MPKLVYVCDMHVGHKVGLANPSQTPLDAGTPVREAFHEKWTEATSGPWSNPDVLVINGDAVDGQGGKRGGSEQWTTDLQHQATCAGELIDMWGAKVVYVLRGSNYHVEAGRTGLNVEEFMARELGAAEWPNQEHLPEKHREHSGYHLYLTVGDVTFHVAHKIGVSRVFHYRSTPIAREMLHMNLNDGLRHKMREMLAKGLLGQINKYRTRVVIRAHAHYYWTCATSGSAGFNLPCWQALSPYMQQSGALAISPDIGFLGFTIEGDKYVAEPVLWNLESAQPPPHVIIGGS